MSTLYPLCRADSSAGYSVGGYPAVSCGISSLPNSEPAPVQMPPYEFVVRSHDECLKAPESVFSDGKISVSCDGTLFMDF